MTGFGPQRIWEGVCQASQQSKKLKFKKINKQKIIK
jgi:hypothetical protein